ncbi:MAG: hypothetical protein MUO91_04745 [candidate division Zixibacteria bacterium]|nr:hypothetical protein [candidate division Zixibacteria bacterium]
MKSCIRVDLPTKREYSRQPIEIELDNNWKRKRKEYPEIVKRKGVYVLYVKNSPEILYIGKTGGETMDFATRLYRHATKSASRNSKVYQDLKRIKGKGKRIYAGLIDVERIKTFFSGKKFSNLGYIDVFEQVAIHFFNPKLQQYQK